LLFYIFCEFYGFIGYASQILRFAQNDDVCVGTLRVGALKGSENNHSGFFASLRMTVN